MSTWLNDERSGFDPVDYEDAMARLWPRRVQAVENRIASGELPSRTVDGFTPDELREQNPELLREINHELALDLIHEHGIRADSRQAASDADYYWGAGMPERAYASPELELDEVVPDDTTYYVDRADAWYNVAKMNGERREVQAVDTTDRLSPLPDSEPPAPETWRRDMERHTSSPDYGVPGNDEAANQQREQLAQTDLLHHLIDRDMRQLNGEQVAPEDRNAPLFTRLVAEYRGQLAPVATTTSWAGLHEQTLPSLDQANELRELVQGVRTSAELPPLPATALDRQLGLWATYPEALNLPLADQLTTGLGPDNAMDRWFRAGQLLDTHEQALARNDPAAINGPDPRVAQLLREHDGVMERTLTDPRFPGIVADDLARRGLEHGDEQVTAEIGRIARDSGTTVMVASPTTSTSAQATPLAAARAASGVAPGADAGDPGTAGRTEELLRSARANLEQARAILADDTPRTPAHETSDQSAIVTLTSISLGNLQQGIAVATGGPAPGGANFSATRDTLGATNSPLQGTVQRQPNGSFQVRAFANSAALQRLTANAGQLRDLDVTMDTLEPGDRDWQRQATRLHIDQAAQSLDRTANIAPGRSTGSDAPASSSSRYDWDTTPAQPSRSVKR